MSVIDQCDACGGAGVVGIPGAPCDWCNGRGHILIREKCEAQSEAEIKAPQVDAGSEHG